MLRPPRLFSGVTAAGSPQTPSSQHCTPEWGGGLLPDAPQLALQSCGHPCSPCGGIRYTLAPLSVVPSLSGSLYDPIWAPCYPVSRLLAHHQCLRPCGWLWGYRESCWPHQHLPVTSVTCPPGDHASRFFSRGLCLWRASYQARSWCLMLQLSVVGRGAPGPSVRLSFPMAESGYLQLHLQSLESYGWVDRVAWGSLKPVLPLL